MRILHLEDDGPLREILEAALKATAPTCEIHQFVNSDDALRYATENVQAVDLYILDVRVPGSMNGLQMAEKLRALNCPGVIVITSAYRAPDEAVLRQLGCEWYPKPWHLFEAATKLMTMAQRKPAVPPVTPVVPTVPPAVPVSADAAPMVPPQSPAPAMPPAPVVTPASAAVLPESPAPVMLPAPPATPVIAAPLPEPSVPAAPPAPPAAPVSADAAPFDPPTTPLRSPSSADNPTSNGSDKPDHTPG